MKILKLVIISVVFLSLLITAFSLLLPSRIIISRAVDINSPIDSVYVLVNDLKNWKEWMDNFNEPNTEISQVSKGKGAFINTGNVKVVIVNSIPTKVSAKWQTGKNTPLPGEFNFISNDSFGHTTVQWQFVHQVKWYPWQKFASIVSDKVIGPYMEKSLDNLKVLAENR